jgi:hypothetical protein
VIESYDPLQGLKQIFLIFHKTAHPIGLKDAPF